MTERQIRTLIKNYRRQLAALKYKTIPLEDWLRKNGLTEEEIKYGLTIR